MASTQHSASTATNFHDEKAAIVKLEQLETRSTTYDPDVGLDDESRRDVDKKLVRKIDLKLIPWLSFLYLISFLDRTNIGNAKVDGLITDLRMSAPQYNITLTVFFITYALFEPLTNVLLKRFRPSVFLPLIMILWGTVMVTMGLVENFGGLATARVFLGITEAGLFPGVSYYLSSWYKRHELGIRLAIFFSAAAIAGSFGGLLAAGIAQMRGLGGKPGWAWIFILEGLATVIVAAVSYWMIQDFPDEAKFLSDDDRARVLLRLSADGQASAHHEDLKSSYIWAALRDWKTYAYAAIFTGAVMPLYAFSLFLPTIVTTLGYSGATANLISVPPYVGGALNTIFIGWYADRSRRRGWCNVACACTAITGFIMLLSSTNAGVKYAGTFLGALGIYPCIPNTVTWASNNFEGNYKRGVALGMVIGFGNLNGVVASNIFRAVDSPRFLLGHGTILGYQIVLLLGGSLFVHFALKAENRKRSEGKRDAWVAGKTPAEIEELGDNRPDFIYVL